MHTCRGQGYLDDGVTEDLRDVMVKNCDPHLRDALLCQLHPNCDIIAGFDSHQANLCRVCREINSRRSSGYLFHFVLPTHCLPSI